MMQFSIHAQFNNYQAIIVSEVGRTYVVFLYICGDIQWSAVGRNTAAVVGFTADGKYFKNHPLSRFSGVGDAVSCTFDVGKRRKRQDGKFNSTSNVLKVPAKIETVELVKKCLDAYEKDKFLLESSGFNVTFLAQMLYPCPCTRAQAIMDRGRFRKQDDMPNCYYSTNPVELDLYIEMITLTQQCCYDNNG